MPLSVGQTPRGAASRWPTCSSRCGPAPRLFRALPLPCRADVQGLRNLWKEAELRQPPEPLDGRHAAPLRPEPPARPRPLAGQGPACVRLHAMPEGRESPEGRLRAWLVDRKVDRMARKPFGRAARRNYGSPTAHDFLWPGILDALQLTKDDRLLDVGCGGGAFIRHVRETIGCEVAGVDHSRQMVKLAQPYAA